MSSAKEHMSPKKLHFFEEKMLMYFINNNIGNTMKDIKINIQLVDNTILQLKHELPHLFVVC